MVVERLTKHSITLNSVTDPQPSGWGYDLNDWDNLIYRVREDLTNIQIGDIVQLYVPTTDVYITRVSIDEQRPSLSGWYAWQVGRQPTPEFEDSGLFFHPSADESLNLERLFRPYEMLDEGVLIADAAGDAWTFEAPFLFTDAGGERGTHSGH